MRFLSLPIAFVFGFALYPSLPVVAADLGKVDKFVIAQECEAVLLAYGERMDNGDKDDAAALFTEDADFLVRGKPLKGRDAIRAAFANQHNPNDPTVTQHIFTNIRVEVVDRDHCKLKAYEVIYRYDPTNPEKNTSLAPTLIGKLDDEFVRMKDNWRYAKRHLTAVTLAKPTDPQ